MFQLLVLLFISRKIYITDFSSGCFQMKTPSLISKQIMEKSQQLMSFRMSLILVKWKWQNRDFWQIFFHYKFLYVKIVANTNKTNWWGHIDWKLKLKKNELFSLIWWLSVALQTVANITMPTSFHQCLGVKPCFETKFCQKFPYKIYFSVMWKVVAQSTTFAIYYS